MKKNPASKVVFTASPPTSFELPPHLSRELGRVITQWAYLEWHAQALLWKISGVDRSIGRLLFREPRLADRLDMIRDVALVKSLPFDERRLGKIRSVADSCARKRDLLAHGVFARIGDHWYVVLSRGTWPKELNRKHRSKKVEPEGIIVDIRSLKNLQSVLKALKDALKLFSNDLESALEASSKKPL